MGGGGGVELDIPPLGETEGPLCLDLGALGALGEATALLGAMGVLGGGGWCRWGGEATGVVLGVLKMVVILMVCEVMKCMLESNQGQAIVVVIGVLTLLSSFLLGPLVVSPAGSSAVLNCLQAVLYLLQHH